MHGKNEFISDTKNFELVISQVTTHVVRLPVERLVGELKSCRLKVEREVFRLKTEGERELFFEHRMMKSLRSASL